MVARLSALSEYASGDLESEMPPLPGDQIALTTSVNQIRGNLRGLLGEIVGLTQAAVSGRLQVRGDTEAHLGAFGAVVKEVNATLDAIIRPVTEASVVLTRLAARDFSARMHGDYQGDHAAIKPK